MSPSPADLPEVAPPDQTIDVWDDVAAPGPPMNRPGDTGGDLRVPPGVRKAFATADALAPATVLEPRLDDVWLGRRVVVRRVADIDGHRLADGATPAGWVILLRDDALDPPWRPVADVDERGRALLLGEALVAYEPGVAMLPGPQAARVVAAKLAEFADDPDEPTPPPMAFRRVRWTPCPPEALP